MDFILGCNYWASNAGTEMWVQWDEDVVKEDLKILIENGVSYIRVFPIWRDFQPVKPSYAGSCRFQELLYENDNRLDNPYFLDMEMVARFRRFCEIAQELGVKLIVGLITGWMSGRMYIPSALYGKNLFTDPLALLLQQKYVRGLVTLLKDCPAIDKWDLGNECNVMYPVSNNFESANWTSIISSVIRATDPTREIVSGMHSLTVGGGWTIADQGEYTDILTTHPYPYWTPHAREDRLSSIRALMHATAESVYYGSISGRPCLVEEIGTMGPMNSDNETAGKFLRVNFFSNWANGQPGVMWWCANEQSMLDHPPYTWKMLESELGMLDKYRQPKPVLREMKKFSEFLSNLTFELPKAKVDACCILSQCIDDWGVAYVTYILAKQAGINIVFCDVDKPLPDADIYLFPSTNYTVMYKSQYDVLREKISAGSKILITNDGGMYSDFEEFSGVMVIDSENEDKERSMVLNGAEIKFNRQRKFVIKETTAKVIARDSEDMPCFTVNKFGKGEVYYLNFPLEKNLIDKHNAYYDNCHKVYSEFFKDELDRKCIKIDNQLVSFTEHYTEDGAYVVLINYSGETQKTNLKISDGYEIDTVYYKNPEELEPFDAAIVYLKKK